MLYQYSSVQLYIIPKKLAKASPEKVNFILY